LILRDRIRRWQTQLRVLFVIRVALWKYRMRLPGFQLPETVSVAQRKFDDELAKTLEGIADRCEGKPDVRKESRLEDWFKPLEQTVGLRAGQLKTFLALCRRSEELVNSLDREIPLLAEERWMRGQ